MASCASRWSCNVSLVTHSILANGLLYLCTRAVTVGRQAEMSIIRLPRENIKIRPSTLKEV
jgi:hypothetical protein